MILLFVMLLTNHVLLLRLLGIQVICGLDEPLLLSRPVGLTFSKSDFPLVAVMFLMILFMPPFIYLFLYIYISQ